MRRALAILLMLVAAAVATPAMAAADCPNADLHPAADNLGLVGQATLCLLNEQRAAGGLHPLTEDPGLTTASTAYSLKMVTERFFAHVDPAGGDLVGRLTQVGYLGGGGSWMVGENIAWGESYLATPANIVTAWMNSPGHRENILTPEFREIGLGIALGTPLTPNPGATYTTDFGMRTAPEQPVTQSQDPVAIGQSDQQAIGASRGAATRSKTATIRRAAAKRAAAKRAAAKRAAIKRAAIKRAAIKRAAAKRAAIKRAAAKRAATKRAAINRRR